MKSMVNKNNVFLQWKRKCFFRLGQEQNAKKKNTKKPSRAPTSSVFFVLNTRKAGATCYMHLRLSSVAKFVHSKHLSNLIFKSLP